MPKQNIDPLYYHKKAGRMIERYKNHNEDLFYIFSGQYNGGKSIDFIKSILKDPRLAPYDLDNDEPAN